MSDGLGVFIFYAIILGGFLLIMNLFSWLTGTKVKSRHGGIEYGSPDTIPILINFLSSKSKSIYKKIQTNIDNKKFTSLNASADKISLLKQLGDIKEQGVITEEEFEILKLDILKK